MVLFVGFMQGMCCRGEFRSLVKSKSEQEGKGMLL